MKWSEAFALSFRKVLPATAGLLTALYAAKGLLTLWPEMGGFWTAAGFLMIVAGVAIVIEDLKKVRS